jgi:hypothetical protein
MITNKLVGINTDDELTFLLSRFPCRIITEYEKESAEGVDEWSWNCI